MKALLPCIALASFTASTFAAPPPETAKTNVLQAILSTNMPDLHQALEYTGPQRTFAQEYLRRIDRNSDSILNSRIGYAAGFPNYLDSLHHRSDWAQTEAHTGARAVKSLLADDLRDTLASRLNLVEPSNQTWDWIWRHSVQFVANSLANSSENRQRLSIYSSEEDIIQDEGWAEAHPHGWIPRFGYRFFDPRPDAYFESSFGRQTGGLPIAYLDLRGYSDFGSLQHFGRIKTEAILRLPVDHLFQVSIGFSGYPLDNGDQLWGEVIRIDCPLRSVDGIFSIGAHHTDRQDRVVSQVSWSF